MFVFWIAQLLKVPWGGDRGLCKFFYFSFSAFAAEQRRDTNSMLNWTERIIRMRKEVPEVGWGPFDILDVGSDAVLGLRYDWRNNSVLFLPNFAHDPCELEFSAGLKDDRGNLLVNLLGADHSRAADNGKHKVCIEGYGYRWYRVGGLD
jgi:maltose alpha-D-glucosyltransferase / alpha-amylase